MRVRQLFSAPSLSPTSPVMARRHWPKLARRGCSRARSSRLGYLADRRLANASMNRPGITCEPSAAWRWASAKGHRAHRGAMSVLPGGPVALSRRQMAASERWFMSRRLHHRLVPLAALLQSDVHRHADGAIAPSLGRADGGRRLLDAVCRALRRMRSTSEDARWACR
jgi:hypothetical protein